MVCVHGCFLLSSCYYLADHAALSQAKKIRRSRSRPYSEHGNLAGRGLWWPLISPQADRPELATETPEKPQSQGNMGGRHPAVIAGYPTLATDPRRSNRYTIIITDHASGRLRNFWGAARISGLSPDGPSTISPSQNAVVHPDPYRVRPIHSPAVFLLSWRPVRVPCKLLSTPSPVFPPCDDLFTVLVPTPITIIPPASVSRPRRPSPHRLDRARHTVQSSQKLTVISLPCLALRPALLRCACAVVCFAVLCCGCAVLPCDPSSNWVGPQSYCRQLPFCVAKPNPLPLRSQDFPRTETTSSRPPPPRQISSKLPSYPSTALRLRLGAFRPRFSTRAHSSTPNW